MAGVQQSANGNERGSAAKSWLVEPLRSEVHRLGESLGVRVEEVVERITERSRKVGPQFDAITSERFAAIGRTSTTAVAQWLAGGRPEEGRETSQKTFETYGQLAAQRLAPLNEVTKRCLRWRDAVTEVLSESAAQLRVSPEALTHAITMVQRTLDVTVVRVCECFEIERQRTDEELARHREELAYMATHDALTQLPNRTLILDRCAQALMRARRTQLPVAALFIDVDNFKGINDKLGHDAGDELLRVLAARLDGVIRETDALGRLGGDEFVVIAEGTALAAGPEMIAERLRDALREPFSLVEHGETELKVTVSIGIAVAQGGPAEDLLGNADLAMYRAKLDGKDRYVAFESEMYDAAHSRSALEMDLQDAIEHGQFFLVYQPIFNLREMRPKAVEALLRWRHPTRGVVQPNDFISVLEGNGRIVEVGRWVLQQACRQGADWRSAGREIGMTVNVSARQLDTEDFVGDVQDALLQSGLDADALTLEITETTLMQNIDATASCLRAIRELGVRIAIDDFGTGYSSLAHLQRFRVDSLKIDRSFIAGLRQNPEGETLIHTLVQLGKALSIETLAEGVEQQDELSLLREEQCDSCQGFLFARPLEADAAERFLDDWSNAHVRRHAGATP